MELNKCKPGVIVKVNRNHDLYEELLSQIGEIKALNTDSDGGAVSALVSFPKLSDHILYCPIDHIDEVFPITL